MGIRTYRTCSRNHVNTKIIEPKLILKHTFIKTSNKNLKANDNEPREIFQLHF